MELEEHIKQMKELEETPIKDIWMSELDELEIAYKKWFEIEEEKFNDLSKGKSKPKDKKGKKKN